MLWSIIPVDTQRRFNDLYNFKKSVLFRRLNDVLCLQGQVLQGSALKTSVRNSNKSFIAQRRKDLKLFMALKHYFIDNIITQCVAYDIIALCSGYFSHNFETQEIMLDWYKCFISSVAWKTRIWILEIT